MSITLYRCTNSKDKAVPGHTNSLNGSRVCVSVRVYATDSDDNNGAKTTAKNVDTTSVGTDTAVKMVQPPPQIIVGEFSLCCFSMQRERKAVTLPMISRFRDTLYNVWNNTAQCVAKKGRAAIHRGGQHSL